MRRIPCDSRAGRWLILLAFVTRRWWRPTRRGPGRPDQDRLDGAVDGPFAQIGKDMVNGTGSSSTRSSARWRAQIELTVETPRAAGHALNSRASWSSRTRSPAHRRPAGNVGYALQPFIDGAQIPATYPVIARHITQRKPPGGSCARAGHQPADAPVRRLGAENTKYKRSRPSGWLRRWLRDGGRLPARVREAGQDRRDLDAAQHERLRAVLSR